MLGYDCHLFFSMPYALARSSIPCLFLLFVSFLQARQRSGTLAFTPGLLGHPVRLFREMTRKQMVLSSSQATPLNICPALRPRWCPQYSPYRFQDCCLPLKLQRRLSPPKKLAAILDDFSSVHDYTNFGAQSRGLHPCSPWLRTSVTGLTRRVRYWSVG